MKNPKIKATFNDRIIEVWFDDDAVINSDDLEEIYDFANRQSKGEQYCILFEASKSYEVTDDALEFMANNPHNKNILAKVYIVDHKEAEVKTRLHLLFDHPSMKPFVFKTHDAGMEYLRDRIKEHAHS